MKAAATGRLLIDDDSGDFHHDPRTDSQVGRTGESETLEFKKSTGALREAAKTACAMLNQRGGIILFGVSPEGKVIGQTIGESTIEDASAEFQRIDPPAFPSIERIPVSGELEALVVRVNRGDMVPYRYKDIAYRRVGNTNQRMSRHDENRMFMERAHIEQRWENQFASDWTINDLDIEELNRTVTESYTFREIGRSRDQSP